jgi:sec-independent protein translocase protein TatB
MFDIAPTELLLCAVVALLVIGPKDLPRAMRVVGHWVGRARGVARQFRSGFDTMVREAELEEMEKKWKAENERIMREHPPESLYDQPRHGEPTGLLPHGPHDDLTTGGMTSDDVSSEIAADAGAAPRREEPGRPDDAQR